MNDRWRRGDEPSTLVPPVLGHPVALKGPNRRRSKVIRLGNPPEVRL